MLLANNKIFNNVNYDLGQDHNQNLLTDDEFELNPSSDAYLSDYYFTGPGDNQDVRLYVGNNSNSYNNEGDFNFPSMSDTDTGYLTNGNFNFTFQNNYTTDYIIENTNALNASSFIKFNFDDGISLFNLHTGTASTLTNIGRLTDGNPATDIILNGDNGIINFSLDAGYTGTSYSSGPPAYINLNFNRNFILGIILSLSYQLSKNAYITLKMLNASDSTWINVTEPIFVNSSLGVQQINEKIINQNLNYIDDSEVNHIQFYIERFTIDAYSITLKTFNEFSTYGFDIPITNTNYVALEFDLKGTQSSVNGFYAWIRTLNLTRAVTAELNVTLYGSDRTIPRSDDEVQNDVNLRTILAEPDYSTQIDSFVLNFDDYHGDNLAYFEFNTANTGDLPLDNYFIVIKSDQSELIHSLVTLPRATYGDPDLLNGQQGKVDHQLKRTNDDGLIWTNAKKTVETTSYTSEQLDASPFKLNVTRGYMPSDFYFSQDDTLNIQEIPILNQVNNSFPYNESSSLTWGLGTWNNTFTTPIVSDGFNNFNIDLTWNNSNIKGFLFNVSFSVKAYWIENNALSFYNVSYDTIPEWTLNYTLDLGYKNFDNWDYIEFWFVYPNDYNAHNLTNPNLDEIYDEILNETGGEAPLTENPSLDATKVSKNITNGINGLYSLQLNSSNLISQMHSYINYNGILWETNGFMYGDDISVGLDIQDHNGNAPLTGNANVKLFYPKDAIIYNETNDSPGVIENDMLKYDFNNETLMEVRNDISVVGNYYLGFFWSNDSAIGCKKLKLYIDSYNVSMDEFFYEALLDQNVLDGGIDRVYDEYSILIASVNDTTGLSLPNFYPVNYSNLNQEFIYEISGNEIPIIMNTFLQNETILNPDENINIITQIQNMHELIDIKLKVGVKLVSLANEEWIIDEQITAPKTLKLKGDPLGRDIQDFSIDLSIPTLQTDDIWQGLNAPVRRGGVKTILTIYIEANGEFDILDNFESSDYALLVNDTDSVFEGYILSLKYDQEITGATIQKPFNREDCIYLPDQTTFVVNIFDRNYVSSYSQFIQSFTLKTNSIFSNVSSNPETPISGSEFNFSSALTTEFGIVLPNKNITLQYYNNTSWVNLSSQFSDINGSTNFEIDTLLLNDEDELLFRLSWEGDAYIQGIAQNESVVLYQVLNKLEISLIQNVPFMYRNKNSTVRLNILNTGDSTLKITDITIINNPSVEFSLVEINNLALNSLSANESTDVYIELKVPIIRQLEIYVSVEAKNILTNEIITKQISKSFEIYDIPLLIYLTMYIIFIMLGVFLIIWGLTFLYSKRTIRKIETPIEEPTKKQPRRARYVKVSEIEQELQEIPKEEIAGKKIKKLKKEKEAEEEKATDLDSLLEREGLKENNNK